jgi:hypothetical protein
MEMIKNITYLFPNHTPAEQDFFHHLDLLLEPLQNTSTEGEVVLSPTQPAHSLPATVLALADVAFPQVQFEMDGPMALTVGNLCINPQPSTSLHVESTPRKPRHEHALPMDSIYARLRGHITRLDHTGINIPSSLIPRDTWQRFINHLAAESNMYRYPTGEDWPFMLPATQEEYEMDITQFPVGREPRCELVYDQFSVEPTIQIDVETDLAREQVEELFPDPYGISFPDLADYFRTVYIEHEWPGLRVRFDIRFKSDEPGDYWETGKWLVTKGGRI